MHTRVLGRDLRVSAIGLGAMGMSQVVIATKFGWRIEDGRSVGLDSRPEQIRRVAEASLRRLRASAHESSEDKGDCLDLEVDIGAGLAERTFQDDE